jgi:hypothetical protein
VTTAHGQFTIPADVSVQMSAVPTAGLLTGQPFVVTLTVTNHGPEPADPLMIISSAFTNKLDPSVGEIDCPYMGVVVSDGETYYYQYAWIPTIGGAIEIGQTLTCHITLALSASAPDIYVFGFEIPSFIEDLDPSNNSASVTLRRAAATVLPAMSVPGMLAMLFTLGLAGALAARSNRRLLGGN